MRFVWFLNFSKGRNFWNNLLEYYWVTYLGLIFGSANTSRVTRDIHQWFQRVQEPIDKGVQYIDTIATFIHSFGLALVLKLWKEHIIIIPNITGRLSKQIKKENFTKGTFTFDSSEIAEYPKCYINFRAWILNCKKGNSR